MQADIAPHDNQSEHQIELQVEDQLAVSTYEIDGQVMIFTHTFVPETLRGRGLASKLIKGGLESAKSRGFKIIPRCTAFAAYMKSHPETHDMLAPGGREAMEA
jgi:predicted GNAT family acetyltransferase